MITDKGNLGKQETSRADAEVVWKNLTGIRVGAVGSFWLE